MIPVVISATTFESNESACLQRIKELTITTPDSCKSVLLNENFLQKNTSINTETLSVSRINLSDWIDTTQQPLKIKIRGQADSLNTNQSILIDARHHEPHIISIMLHEISQVWFHLPSWQPAFVLVVDDFHASRFTRELSEAFYIPSLPTSKKAIHAEIRSMNMQIWRFRWLGFSPASHLIYLTYSFLQKLKRYVYRKIS